jgi:hypothetical protein
LHCFNADCLYSREVSAQARDEKSWTKNQHKPNTERNQQKMKAIRMRIQKSSRPGVILLATAVVIITSMVVANATQTITTPNAASISYSLAVGASSAAITPATNKPVLVMGCCTTAGNAGVGQVSLLHIPSNAIEWVGLESYNGAAITQGISAVPAHVVFIDLFQHVDIRVNTADTIIIHNGATAARAGNVTLIW